ncbi:uncharacterized protein LACBIDRAFT_317895 [Laccaria bicolor S238N-H82]|uniref:Predicted protein n=1 Tax=Laccaria bicolor (strain S238N-H82 / ATCC MYA-4686) TaxID=486041 RepID=B0D5G8_LACBS|nr:uncharacterized protein LACBIDRAFT_317895 [Laccaria bicolor S238N-H82]EDR10018.1 predicted protein [Laccaria bicolor S238N-H82]|eukprot:XP_001879403.1 predicted protein [Laccaria bicolor S238N-H82]
MDAVRKEITELTTRVQALRGSPAQDPADSPPKLEETPLFPPPASGIAGGSRWQEILLYHEMSNIHQNSASSFSSPVSGSNVSFFWGSRKQSSSSSAEDEEANSESFKVEIGFRATMVTVDRGGWFQPQFFKQSSEFYHIDKKIFNSKWPDGVERMDGLRNAKPAEWEELNKGLFPAYPVGFIICKDITIMVAMSEEQVKKHAGEFANSAESSSGIFCWSTSRSSHSKRSEKDISTSAASDGLVIRIPGPQILGYMMQYPDNDISQDLRRDLPDDFLIPDEDYEGNMRARARHLLVQFKLLAVRPMAHLRTLAK